MALNKAKTLRAALATENNFPVKETTSEAGKREEKEDGTKEAEPSRHRRLGTLSRVAAEEGEVCPSCWLVDCYPVKNKEIWVLIPL